jgi:hypothetical protein
MLKKRCPALLQRAEPGAGPDPASPDRALVALDPRRVIRDPLQQGVFNPLLMVAGAIRPEPRRDLKL